MTRQGRLRRAHRPIRISERRLSGTARKRPRPRGALNNAVYVS